MGIRTSNGMGETADQIYKEYKQVRKQNNGVLLSHLQSGQTYFLREVSYAREIDYQKQLQRLRKQTQKEENQNIIKIVKYWGKQYNNFCSNSYKVYSVYESPEITLLDEVAAREKEQRFFEQCDLWSILQSCTKALVDLKPTMSVEPSKIYIQADGLLKVVHNDMTDDQYRCVINQKVYYAPQKILNFSRPDKINSLQKEAVFSMGMTMLHASLLQDLHQFYDYKNSIFHQQKLEEALSMLQSRYTQQYIEIMAMILETNPNKRPSLIDVNQILEEKFPFQQQGNESNMKPERQTTDLKESQTVEACQNIYHAKSQNDKMKNQANLAPLGQFKNEVHTYQTGKNNNYYVNRESLYPPTQAFPNTNNNYTTYQSKQNLFTDPKLLEMIRNDLKQINSIKKSSFYQTSNFGLLNSNSPNTYVSQNNYGVSDQFSRTSLAPMEFKTSAVQSQNNCNYDRGSSQLQTSVQQVRKSQKRSFNSSKRLQQHDQDQIDEVLRSQSTHQSQPKIISVPVGRNCKIPVFTTESYEDGRYFEGMMVNGIKQGHGKMIYAEGSYYEGNFKDDKMHGEGVLYYEQDKPAYEGEWSQDQFHGQGILYSQCPTELEGMFDYSDFNSVQDYWVKYEGNFINDNKCGNGRLYLSNGEVFTGNFENDCINGQGQFRNMIGEVIKGIWTNNNLVEVLDE